MNIMSDAFRAAGYRSADDRLMDAAKEALKAHPVNYDDAYAVFRTAVCRDAELTWALFDRFEEAAIRPILARASHEIHQARRAAMEGDAGPADLRQPDGPRPASSTRSASAGSGGGRLPAVDHDAAAPSAESIAARGAAITAAAARSLLDTFMVNGRPIGDVSAGEAKSWARNRKVEWRFVELITAGVMDNQPLRRWVTPEEADAALRRAQADANA